MIEHKYPKLLDIPVQLPQEDEESVTMESENRPPTPSLTEDTEDKPEAGAVSTPATSETCMPPRFRRLCATIKSTPERTPQPPSPARSATSSADLGAHKPDSQSVFIPSTGHLEEPWTALFLLVQATAIICAEAVKRDEDNFRPPPLSPATWSEVNSDEESMGE